MRKVEWFTRNSNRQPYTYSSHIHYPLILITIDWGFLHTHIYNSGNVTTAPPELWLIISRQELLAGSTFFAVLESNCLICVVPHRQCFSGVFDLAVEQPQLFRKLYPPQKNTSLYSIYTLYTHCTVYILSIHTVHYTVYSLYSLRKRMPGARTAAATAVAP